MEQYKKWCSVLNVDKSYETETAHINYFHLPLFLQEKGELRIKATGGWQKKDIFPRAQISVELSLIGKCISFSGKGKEISQYFW